MIGLAERADHHRALGDLGISGPALVARPTENEVLVYVMGHDPGRGALPYASNPAEPPPSQARP